MSEGRHKGGAILEGRNVAPGRVKCSLPAGPPSDWKPWRTPGTGRHRGMGYLCKVRKGGLGAGLDGCQTAIKLSQTAAVPHCVRWATKRCCFVQSAAAPTIHATQTTHPCLQCAAACQCGESGAGGAGECACLGNWAARVCMHCTAQGGATNHWPSLMASANSISILHEQQLCHLPASPTLLLYHRVAAQPPAGVQSSDACLKMDGARCARGSMPACLCTHAPRTPCWQGPCGACEPHHPGSSGGAQAPPPLRALPGGASRCWPRPRSCWW